MRKQFKWVSILVAALAVALLAVMPTAAAPALVAGTITLDKTWATAVGTTITVTVTDADLNVALTQAAEATDFSNAAYQILANSTLGTPIVRRVKKFPILDRTGAAGVPDGVVNFLDVIPSAGVEVFSVSASEGLVTFHVTAAGVTAAAVGGGTVVPFDITYNAADVNNTGTAVKVYSTTDTTGCVIQLDETGPNTGVFTKTFKTAAATNCAATPKELIAGNGATITAAYADASPSQTVTAAATVETVAPTLSNLSPVSGTASSTTVQTLFVDVTDAQSGVASASIVIKIGLDNGDGAGDPNDGILHADEVDATPTVTTTAISGGFRAQATTGALSEGAYVWSVEASDNAGNAVVLDIDTTVDGKQGQKLKIDSTPPTYNNSGPGGTNLGKTGEYWDTATKTIKFNRTTSLSVVFSEALDGTTVDKSDFTVVATTGAAAATPLDAYWTSDQAEYVFLTVVALGPADKPVVAMVGALKDKAGTSMVPQVSATIQDGIAPTITAALDKPLVRTTGSVVLTMVSNEALGAVPVVTFDEAPAGSVSPAAVPAGANQWTWTFAGATDGSYVLKVAGTDTSNNNGTAGVSRWVAGTLSGGTGTSNPDYATKGIAFERDSLVDDPTVSAGGTTLGANPSVYTANPYIVVDFTVEASEYGIKADDTVVVKRGPDGLPGTGDDIAVVTNTDTRKKATISKATLDGTAITLSADAASVKFTYPASGLALGEHTLVLNYTDEAGNVRGADLSLKFTVKARPSYSIPLVAGMNLISFPATPEKPALKDAFAGTAADLVVTYDPSALAGPWLIAQKGADGTWSGTLAAVDNLHGYWVRSTGVASISVDIPDRGFQDLPPSIAVVAGWNLVPVVSISGGAAPNFPRSAGYAVAATVAFSGLPGIPKATDNLPFGYSYAPLTGNWAKLLSGDDVTVGSAYWVYATAKGTITP